MKNLHILFALLLISTCGGGGGGGSAPSAPAPQNITVSLTSSADSAEVNSSITLTWSSTLATSCSASGSWSGSKGTSGSESITIGVGGSNTFSLSCSATGANSGSASTTVNGLRYFDGKVFDGYIRGAEVFVDTNNNLSMDSDESSVTTDNQGDFNKLLYNDGTLVSIGGIDSDTGVDLSKLTLAHKLEGFEESKLASPFTTLIAYMSDASTINAALGIDASINLLTTDPIPNLGGGIYDFMYEKGNQLTVLAFTLQNHAGAIDGNSQLYFQAIADQLEESYAVAEGTVDIEDPTFISKLIDKVETARDVTFSPDVKTNINTVLSAVIPLLQVYPDANTTTAVQRFAFSTLQNDVKDSTVMIGNASPTLLKYENNIYDYVASDQGIDEAAINPNYNNAPTISSSTIFSAAENQTSIGSISASDADGDSLTYSISGSEINISSSGVLTFATDPNYETKSSYSEKVSVTDGTDITSQQINISITDVQEVFVQDDTGEQNEDLTLDISVLDNDSYLGITYSLSVNQPSHGFVKINNSNTISYTPDKDWFGEDSFTYSLSAQGETRTGKVVVTYLPINDPPLFNSTDTNFNVLENSSSIISTESATDVENDALTFSLTGNDKDLFSITSDAVITFKSPPDYEDPLDFDKDSIYKFTVNVSDGKLTTSKEIITTVDDENLPATQIGSNFIGQAIGDKCYKCINSGSHDLDNDGDTLVMGRNGTSQVSGWASVYKRSGNSWAEMDSLKLYGAAQNDGFGSKVAIDGDGLKLIGSGARNAIGYVFPFEYINNQWIRNPDYVDYGYIYKSDNGSIKEINISSDGQVMSYIYTRQTGAPSFLIVHGPSENYSFNNNPRATLNINTSSLTHIKSAMNKTGKYIVVTQQNNVVKVLEWDGQNYSQIGNSIDSCANDPASHNAFGDAGLDISDDGKTIAMNSSNISSDSAGAVCVFTLVNSTWTQRGSTIFGVDSSDKIRSGLALSGSGKRLAFASVSYDNRKGKVQIYEWSNLGSDWKITGEALYGESANIDFGELSLSGDGRTIAIGSSPSISERGGNLGQIQTYNLPIN